MRLDPEFMRDVVDWQRAPATSARHTPFPRQINPRLMTAFNRRGVSQPYTHQAQAIDATLNGQNVVVVAGTAGGKSLCFHAPILQALLDDPNARALCLFPTKALAQDQLSQFGGWMSELQFSDAAKCLRAYDGDTPQSQRSAIRAEARIIVSNADMLHVGILPHHTRWSAFFRNLRYVVIDELHSYRGIFGSHVANVIRRLKRLCAFYGSNPVFILASATIANPKEHAERLIEAPVTLVDDDGSPHGERNVIFVNPPITDQELGLRRSADFVVRDIAARLIDSGLQTICFARSRNSAEILLTYLRDRIGRGTRHTSGQTAESDIVEHQPSLSTATGPASIAGYRGGYLPEERRAIEKGLRDGKVRGVVATNALELGIDIGALDACLMLGYPGSVASFWQQSGRAGRRQGASLSIMVGTPDPLDQYLMSHPAYLFKQSPEHARIAPDNLGVLASHLVCATFELPFVRGERLGQANVDDLLDALTDEGDVHRSDGLGGLPLFRDGASAASSASGVRYTWIGEGYPAERVSLRGAGERISIMDERGDQVGETERGTAAARVYPGAIYLHQGATFLITELDLELGRAVARRVQSDHYTQSSAISEVVVLQEFERPDKPSTTAAPVALTADPSTPAPVTPSSGEIEVTTTVPRYRQVQFGTHKTLGWGDIDLPATHLLTVGYWFVLTPEAAKQLEKEGVIGLPNDYGPNWASQRRAARERDGHKCVICGTPETPGHEHHVHHRKPFRTFGYVRGENDHYLRANELDNLMTVCPSCHVKIETAEPVNQALSGLCYVLGNLAPLFVMSDPSDLAATWDIASTHTHQPTVTLYEMVPGGTGLTDELIAHHTQLMVMAAERIRECDCDHGCPACVGPASAPDSARSRNLKQDVLRLIELLR